MTVCFFKVQHCLEPDALDNLKPSIQKGVIVYYAICVNTTNDINKAIKSWIKNGWRADTHTALLKFAKVQLVFANSPRYVLAVFLVNSQ